MRNNLLLIARVLILGAVLTGCWEKPVPPNHPPAQRPHVGAWTGDLWVFHSGSNTQVRPAAWVFNPDGSFMKYRFEYSVYLPDSNNFGNATSYNYPPAQAGVNGQWIPIARGTYSIDYRQDPIVLTLVARGNEGQTQGGVGFLRFADANTMFVALGRPVLVLDESHGAQRWTRTNIRQFPRQ